MHLICILLMHSLCSTACVLPGCHHWNTLIQLVHELKQQSHKHTYKTAKYIYMYIGTCTYNSQNKLN